MLAGAGIVALLCYAGFAWLDVPLYKFLRNFDSGIWHFFDFAAGFQAWTSIAAITFFVTYACGARFSGTNKNTVQKIFDVAAAVLLALIIAAAITWLLKIGFGRMRPLFFDVEGFVGFYPPSFNWAFNSFPSGHAAACFAGLVTIGLMYPKAKPYTWTVAIVFGFSRIFIGMHWPSDVLLGAFIGMCAADFGAVALESMKNKGYNSRK